MAHQHTGRAAFMSALPGLVQQYLPAYLPGCRWFGDKARRITDVHVTEILPIAMLEDPSALTFVDIIFSSGEPASYIFPVVATLQLPTAPDVLIGNVGEYNLIDGLHHPPFRSWLIAIAAGQSGSPSDAIVVDRSSEARTRLVQAVGFSGQVLGVEQSNTSIRYGQNVLLKVFRRQQYGLNPDVEITRFLTSKAKFGHVPEYLASVSHRTPSGSFATIACAQSFVENTGDGWSFVLTMIRGHVETSNIDTLNAKTRPLAEQLGRTTANMHVALASDPWTPEMAPEPIRRADAERWSADYLAVLDRAKEAVTAYFDHFSPETQEIARLYLRCSPGLTKRNQGFYELIGSSKIRVHGDYHLGQTLRTIDDEFVVIDFEGEPQRTIEERRRKTSPLKDVAGMLRSFSYSRGTASTWITPESALTAADLAIWEREMRRAFLAGYELTARGSGASFLPESKEDFHEALAAWELDKAAYEVLYEINNRPNWLWIPLSGMLKWCEPRQ